MAEWIIPCNLKYYDVDQAFYELQRIDWKQSTNIRTGDTVYIYIGAPISGIKYICHVNKTDLSIPDIDDHAFEITNSIDADYGRYMELELTGTCNPEQLSLSALQAHGLTGQIQGPRRVQSPFDAYLHSSLSSPKPVAPQKEKIPIPQEQTTKVYLRNHDTALAAKARAGGIFQLCDQPAPFLAVDGTPYLESHHIIWLSQGGSDTIDNIAALCPNCHRKMHIVNAAADIKKLLLIVQNTN